jgi:hypothetical protein
VREVLGAWLMFFVLTSKVRPRWSIANFSDETKAEMRQIILVLQLRHWVSDTLGSQHHDRSEHEGGLCPDSLENYWTYEWMGRKKLLSCAARETLIKSVAQSIPTLYELFLVVTRYLQEDN